MRSIHLMLLLAGMFCWTSCTPDEDANNTTGQSETVKQTAQPRSAQPADEPQSDQAAPQTTKDPIVTIKTNKGDIKVELYADKAPVTVNNFLSYVNDGFYDGTVFHRVIGGFMIQGGGMMPNLQPKPTKPPIVNESTNKIRNSRGTIAMARTNAPDSATSQFFINLVDNRSLDFDGPYAPGYAVFGKVISGMNVVDAIAAIPTRPVGPHRNVPTEQVIIESIKVDK